MCRAYSCGPGWKFCVSPSPVSSALPCITANRQLAQDSLTTAGCCPGLVSPLRSGRSPALGLPQEWSWLRAEGSRTLTPPSHAHSPRARMCPSWALVVDFPRAPTPAVTRALGGRAPRLLWVGCSEQLLWALALAAETMSHPPCPSAGNPLLTSSVYVARTVCRAREGSCREARAPHRLRSRGACRAERGWPGPL